MAKAAVELTREWRKDRAFRHLEALLLWLIPRAPLLSRAMVTSSSPMTALCAIGSGGPFALAAARALLKHSKLIAKDIAIEAMRIASEICIYTNGNFTVEELG